MSRLLPWLLLLMLAGCVEGQKPTPQQRATAPAATAPARATGDSERAP
jgi:hypothetical protein